MKKIFIIISLCLLCLSQNAEAGQSGKPFFRNWTSLEYGGHNRNFAIECDGKGRVFVANFEGLAIYDGNAWNLIHTPAISRVTSVCVADDGEVLFGGDNLLGRLDKDNLLSADYIIDDLNGSKEYGEITGISKKDGLIHFTTASGISYTVNGDGSISADSTLPAAENAGNENVWRNIEFNSRTIIADLGLSVLATSGYGIVVINDKDNSYYSLTSEDGLCSDSINALSYDGKGSLWGATDNGLFTVNLLPIYSHFSKSDGLVGQVTDILSVNGRLYVGTLQGLFYLDDNKKFKRVEEISMACWNLEEVPGKNAVLASTAEGLFQIGAGVSQISSRHTLCTVRESASSYLSGELNGIYRHRINGEDQKIEDIPNVVKFKKDSDGNIWAVSLDRESYCLKKGAAGFVRENSDFITLLFEYTDNEGRVWNSDNNGSGLTTTGLSETETMWLEPLGNYDIQALEIADGNMWVGGNFGLIQLDMEKMKIDTPYVPVLDIRSFVHEGKDVSVSFANDKIDPIGKTLYSYRLHDNAEWSKWEEDNSIKFNHLALGNYQFKVRSMDTYGQVVETEPVRFRVPTPFFLKWYAILFYIAVIGIGINLLVRLRMHRLKEEQKRLEKIVDERTQELKAAHSQLIKQEREVTVGKLTKGLIDRILNPLNYINNFSHLTTGLAEELKDNIEDGKEEFTEDIYEDSLDILDMMNTNLSKIEQHGMSTTRILKAMEELLKERTGTTAEADISALCQQNADVFKKYYEKDIAEYGIEFELKLPQTPVVRNTIADLLGQIIKYTLSNCLYAVKKKYSKQAYKPVIRLSLATEGNATLISVYDNGIGIEDSIKDKVFDPFFTTKPTGEAPGIGLYVCQQIIQDLKGNISFESVKDEFTEFTIKLN